LIFASNAASAQEPTPGRFDPLPSERPYRDPHKARVLATILPGAGYVYTGEYFRGYGTWVVTATSFIVTPFLFDYGACGFTSIDECTHGAARWESAAMAALSAGIGITTWIRSVRDAPLSAERANEHHRRRELKTYPTLEVSPKAGGQLRAGLTVGW
jgi:hypothetical protein